MCKIRWNEYSLNMGLAQRKEMQRCVTHLPKSNRIGLLAFLHQNMESHYETKCLHMK